VYPVTALGKILSGIIALIGIGFVALPSRIISPFLFKKFKLKRIKKIKTVVQPEEKTF